MLSTPTVTALHEIAVSLLFHWLRNLIFLCKYPGLLGEHSEDLYKLTCSVATKSHLIPICCLNFCLC